MTIFSAAGGQRINCFELSKNLPNPHYSRLAADLSEASGIGRVDGGFRGGFSLRVGD